MAPGSSVHPVLGCCSVRFANTVSSLGNLSLESLDVARSQRMGKGTEQDMTCRER